MQPRAGLHPSEEGNLNRQSLSYVRNLGRPLMAFTNAQAAIPTFLGWAAKKLRAQSDHVYVLTVYVQQNRFDQRVLPPYLHLTTLTLFGGSPSDMLVLARLFYHAAYGFTD